LGTDSERQVERCRAALVRVNVGGVGQVEGVDQNQPACGSARQGDNREGSAEAFWVSMWVRAVVQGCTVSGPSE